MTDLVAESSSTEARRLDELITAFMTSQAITVAARLGIADALNEAEKTAAELAVAVHAHGPSLTRLLGMLSSVGIFAEGSDGKFRQTPLSDLLRSDHPRSQRAIAVMFGSEYSWRPWGELYHTVKEGGPAFDLVFGAPLFDYLGRHPDAAEIINAAMTAGSARDIAAIVNAYDFSRFERIVDVGGGRGGLLEGILTATPNLKGILADQPSVVADATNLKDGPLANRCEVVGIDFFQAVPEGADAYIMKWIIHDWNDVDALKILKNIRRAIRRDGTLLIVEQVLRASNEPDQGKLFDVNMLVLLKGLERSEREFAALLKKADFALTRVIPTECTLSIVECRPV
jgi:O-methyltransferase domain/Dimerisation domain